MTDDDELGSLGVLRSSETIQFGIARFLMSLTPESSAILERIQVSRLAGRMVGWLSKRVQSEDEPRRHS